MDNVWFNPEGYQRTSKTLQKQCLAQLLSFDRTSGRILDVGCGTGNALGVLARDAFDSYLGIDISPDMVEYAKSAHSAENVRFVVRDFLEYPLRSADRFDTVICAACLHWFIPQEERVVNKISSVMAPRSRLFLSCAYHFDFMAGESAMQRQVLREVRNIYDTIAPETVFEDYRFDAEKVKRIFHDFEIVKIHRIEERVAFTCYEDFRDWHLGSGSVLYHQFAEHHRQAAVQDYYRRLYDAYKNGNHEVSYATALMLFQKKDA